MDIFVKKYSSVCTVFRRSRSTDLPMTSAMTRHTSRNDVITCRSDSTPTCAARMRNAENISEGAAVVNSSLHRRVGSVVDMATERGERGLSGGASSSGVWRRSTRVTLHNQYDNVRRWPPDDRARSGPSVGFTLNLLKQATRFATRHQATATSINILPTLTLGQNSHAVVGMMLCAFLPFMALPADV